MHTRRSRKCNERPCLGVMGPHSRGFPGQGLRMKLGPPPPLPPLGLPLPRHSPEVLLWPGLGSVQGPPYLKLGSSVQALRGLAEVP